MTLLIAPVVLAAIIAGVSGLVSAVGAGVANRKNRESQEDANDKNIAFQEQINQQNIVSQEKINQQNLDQQWKMWEATNEYNHPAAQMARYREAGLNPNLIYGQSNTTSPSNVGISQAPTLSAATIQANKYQNVLQNVSMADMYLQTLRTQQEVRSMELDNQFKEQTLTDRVSQAGYTSEHMLQSIASIKADIKNKGADFVLKELDSELKRFEISQLPTIQKLNQNRLSLSNSQVDLIPILKAKEEANLSLTRMQIQLGYTQSLLNSANLEHELIKMDLTKSQIDYTIANKEHILADIDVKLAQIEKYRSDINLNNANINFMDFNKKHIVFNDIMKGYDSLIGKPISFKGLKYLKFLKK